MSWDSDRVRVELCAVMTFSLADGAMTSRHGAEIWLSDDEGKIQRTRKPAATLVAETRPHLLRMLADWMENRDDPSLSALVLETAAAETAGAP